MKGRTLVGVRPFLLQIGSQFAEFFGR